MHDRDELKELVKENDAVLTRIHKSAWGNRKIFERCTEVGCFYCLAMYPKEDLVEWVDDDETPLCPKCSIDSVLPLSPELTMKPSVARGMLKLMQFKYFEMDT